MKKKVFWFFLVGYFLLPVWLRVPVIGKYLMAFFVFAPVLYFGARYALATPSMPPERKKWIDQQRAIEEERAERAWRIAEQRSQQRRREEEARAAGRPAPGSMIKLN